MKYNGSPPRFMLKVWFLTFRKHVKAFVGWLEERKKKEVFGATIVLVMITHFLQDVYGPLLPFF